MFLLHLFKKKVLLHDYAGRYNAISDWEMDIRSQISETGPLLLEMYERVQLLKDDLNVCVWTFSQLT